VVEMDTYFKELVFVCRNWEIWGRGPQSG